MRRPPTNRYPKCRMTDTTAPDSLASLPDFALATLQSGVTQGIFHSLAWYENYLATARPSDVQLRFLTARSAEASAVLPMQLSGGGGHLLPRLLSGVQNYYSCQFGPTVSGPPSQQLFEQLFGGLGADRPDVIDLHPLDRQQPCFDWLRAALRSNGWWVDSYFCAGNWQLQVNGRSYSEYFASLPSRLKNTLRRKKQALERTGQLQLEIIADAEQVERLIDAYTAIYNASWKQPEPYPDFMPGLIRTCARQGWLRAGLAYVDDRPAAAQIWIVHNAQALIYKLAYDEQFGKLSIGSILTAALMQHVIDTDRVELVDYLMGDEPYKRDWMSRRNERWGIIAYTPRTLPGLLAAARHFGGKWLKTIGKPPPGKTPTAAANHD